MNGGAGLSEREREGESGLVRDTVRERGSERGDRWAERERGREREAIDGSSEIEREGARGDR